MKILCRIAHNIKDIRHYHGLSQEGLAANAGVSRAHMGRLENGANAATLNTIASISCALDVDPLILFLPRWIPQEGLISFVATKGGYIDLTRS
ncbi:MULTISPECIES: helix-turn-helix domain-containing protein [Rhodobacterales]|jgi:transcriptional regulator with XRE-family HTH domain|uniref:Anaerobic benzoate catabolism transcriptional regulator n=1 Tax=Pelagimonas varians TaxID=696760 RepID=A0A238L1M5_9RHOB|nr:MULTISPECIES: helix-turn-helix transcriptional regulator [Rhodobacterales]PYG27339.1 helix-turn-helix protein [Pelagimonas varians]SMX48332.1 anaerobic benzoate catabolism transcriptional regulator [Pelagimonas varians]